MPHRPAVALLLIAAAVACSDATAPGLEGSWGGPQASLILTGSGGALTYLCGAGTIDSGWAVSRDGKFAGSGQHFFGGGPLPPQGRPPHPATYAGYLAGAHLVLTVTLTDLQQVLGPFDLLRGGPPVTEQCV
jgi:hypothetical protein